MRIVLTGSSGRVGRAIFGALAADHEIIGIDRTAFSTTHFVDDFTNESLLREVLQGTDAVVHTAALHAPHVGIVPDTEFTIRSVVPRLFDGELPHFNIGTYNGTTCAPELEKRISSILSHPGEGRGPVGRAEETKRSAIRHLPRTNNKARFPGLCTQQQTQ